MRAEDQHMISILYAPASYTHRSYLPEVFLASEIRENTLLNFWLLRHGKLCDLPSGWQPSDATLSLLLSRWHLIPIAAHLIGSYLLRNRILEQGSLLMSDPRQLAFISLPLLHQVTLDEISPQVDTVSCGTAFILSLFPELPTALRQRLMLHFPADIVVTQFPILKTLNHINLLRMALTYAHHYY